MIITKKIYRVFINFLRASRKKKKVVAVLRLKGVISPSFGGFSRSPSLSFETVKKDIDKAFAHKGIKAVVLAINSPGGSAVQAELISNYIRSMSQEKSIPVYSFLEDVAASGGYWLACTSDEIYASENSIVGSIGVIAAGFGFTEAIKKLGVERRIITQGKNKSVYDPFLPVKESDKKIVEAVQKDIYESFKRFVLARRGSKLKLAKNKEKLFSGEFWSGRVGVELGLIDNIGNFYQVMKQKYGDDVEFKFVEKEESWLGKKLKGMMGGSSTPSVNEIISQVKEQLQLEKFSL
jgi:signal peptide peptidase SppA